MTAINVFATLCGVYGDSSFRFDRVYIYTAAITNISQVQSVSSLSLLPKLSKSSKYVSCHAASCHRKY